MLTVVTWLWGDKFTADYVNRLRNMLERNLHLPHRLMCITDTTEGIDPRVERIPLPSEFAGAFRCRRRMWQFSKERIDQFGPRALFLDLDLVIMGDITPLIDRTEPIVMLRIGYANTLSGSFILCDTGALNGAYTRYRDEPEKFTKATGLVNASDQAMVNLHLRGRRVAEWKESDGFAVYFGEGYERFAHLGVGPSHPTPPAGTRVIVLGSDDKHVLEQGAFDWAREHWR